MPLDHPSPQRSLSAQRETLSVEREQNLGLFEGHISFVDETARRLWSEAALPREVVFTHNQGSAIDRPPEATRETLLRRFEGWIELFTADVLAEAVSGLSPTQRREAVEEYRREIQYALSMRFDTQPEALPLGAPISLDRAVQTSVRAFRAIIARRPDWLDYVDRAVAGSGLKWSELLSSDLSEAFLDDLNHLAGFVNLSPVPVQTALLKRGLVVRGGVCQRREDVAREDGTPDARSEEQKARFTHNQEANAAGKNARQAHEDALKEVRQTLEALKAKQKVLKLFLGKEGDVPRIVEARSELQRVAGRILFIEARLRKIAESHIKTNEKTKGIEPSPDHRRVVESAETLQAENEELVTRMHQLQTVTRLTRGLTEIGYAIPRNWSLGQVVASLDATIQALTTRPFSRALPQADETDYAE